MTGRSYVPGAGGVYVGSNTPGAYVNENADRSTSRSRSGSAPSRPPRLAHVVDPAAAVHERVDEEEPVVGGETDVDGERRRLRVADVGDGARREGAVVILLDEPDLGGQRRGRERVIVPRLERPTD